MIDNSQNRRTKRMRLAARIIALGAAGLFLVALIGSAFAADEPFTTEGILLIIIVGVALAGGILSWWRERLASILLVVAALAMGAHIAAYAGRNHILVWLALGFPYLISGGLFLKSSSILSISRRNSFVSRKESILIAPKK